jgi:hypothetical protein
MEEIETLEPDDLHRAAGRIGRRSDGAVDVIVKTARGADRTALRREAEVLRAIGGPEVVQVVDLVDGSESTELVMRSTGGTSLGAALRDPATSPASALQLLAGACDVVARLHARGWGHGRITADHVLLTARGRMRLCSLSEASPIDVEPARATADRAALLRMVDDWTRSPAGPGRDPGLGCRIRAEVLARRTQRLPDDPDPRVLARILRRTGRTSAVRARSSWLAVLALAAASAAVWLVVIPAFDTTDSSPGATSSASAAVADDRTTTAVPTTTTTPMSLVMAPTSTVAPASSVPPSSAVPTTTTPIATDGNTAVVDGRRYRMGADGDLVAVGDWDCDGSVTAAVLRPSTGAVHVFDGWAAAGTPATARPMGRVDGAVTIAGPVGPCGPPIVTTAEGDVIVVGDTAAHP